MHLQIKWKFEHGIHALDFKLRSLKYISYRSWTCMDSL